MTGLLVWSPDTKRLIPLTPAGVSGGETELFWFRDDPAMCAGVPKAGPDVGAYWQKITALIQVADPATAAAWPRELLVDPKDKKTPLAFSMKRHGGRPLTELVIPAEREALSLNWGLDELRDVALSLARLFARLERLGVAQCDSHDGNYLVDWDPDTGLPLGVARVDCLAFGFHWRGQYYGCDKAVFQFLPPELQGRDLAAVEFTREADRFSLACLLFPLLTGGGYPWGFGGGTGTPAERVANKQFAMVSNPAGTTVAPAVEVAYLALPVEVMVLFERALVGDPAVRPSPSEWVKALRRLGTKPPADSDVAGRWQGLTRRLRGAVGYGLRSLNRNRWMLLAVACGSLAWAGLPKGGAPREGAPVARPARGAQPEGVAAPNAPHRVEELPGSPTIAAPGRKAKDPEAWNLINRKGK